MADGDRAAVDVQLLGVDAEPVAAVDHLHGEGFVQLPQVDVARPSGRGASSSLGTANTGPMPISSGSQPATAKPRKTPLRLDAERLGPLARHQQRRPMRRRRVATSCPAVTVPWPLFGSKYGLSARSPSSVVSGRLHSSVSHSVLFLANDLAGLLVENAARHLHRREFFLEEAFLLGARRALLARQRSTRPALRG